VGIALPSWLVDTKNSGLVLGVYVAFLMVIFPTIAICYWNKQRSLAPNQVNNKTMQLFASFLIPKGENMRFKKILSLISMSFEYYTKVELSLSLFNEVSLSFHQNF
jgi:translocation protein SEC63